MSVNPGYTRRKELRCTLEELSTYGAVILYEGEVLYVLQSDGRYAVKVGDGATPVADLPYSVNYTELNALKVAAENAKALADANAAVLVEESEFEKGTLLLAVESLFSSQLKRQTLQSNIEAFADPDANAHIWKEIQSLIAKAKN